MPDATEIRNKVLRELMLKGGENKDLALSVMDHDYFIAKIGLQKQFQRPDGSLYFKTEYCHVIDCETKHIYDIDRYIEHTNTLYDSFERLEYYDA